MTDVTVFGLCVRYPTGFSLRCTFVCTQETPAFVYVTRVLMYDNIRTLCRRNAWTAAINFTPLGSIGERGASRPFFG